MEHVVIPIDGSPLSEIAIAPGAALAAQAGASLLLVTVTTESSDWDVYMKEAAALHDVDADVRVLIGNDPGAQLANFEHNNRAGSVLCMASHARQRVSGTLLGSVAADVVRARPGPVVLVGRHCEMRSSRFSELVVPLDGSSIAEAALPLAEAWSRSLGIPILLVHVIDPLDSQRASGASRGGTDISESAYLTGVARGLHEEGVDASWEVLHDGTPANGIRAFTGRLSSPLMVMATHGRMGLESMLMGSVTTSLVHHATFPVAVIRPLDLPGRTRH